MSASFAPSTQIAVTASVPRASIRGLLRAELRKLTQMRITWVMAGLITVIIAGLQLALASSPNTANQLHGDLLGAFYNVLEGDLSLVRIFSGIFVLILAAHVVGLEYQYGTIRILLGRGVGRLQLLGAKTLALTLAGLALMIWGVLIELVFAVGIVLTNGGQPWSVLGGEFWTDTAVYLLYLLINLVVTLLLGVAAAVLGRPLAFGLAVGLGWFAVDNLLRTPLTLLYQLTHSEFWLNVSGFLLGPLLNRLPDYIAPPYHVTVQTPAGPQTTTQTVSGFGMMPLARVDGTHALLVIGAYALVFAATAIVLTRTRDVQE
jgi:ABC-2 type transport system permease protein